MKRQTNYHALMRLLVCCLIGISSLWSYADITVTIGDLMYSLDDTTKEATVTGSLSQNVNNVVITEKIITNYYIYHVTSIGRSAFRGCRSLTEVTIPYYITSIGYEAFRDCTGLKNLIIEDGEKKLTLGDNLFDGCPLESVYLGRNYSYSNDYHKGYPPFYSKEKLTSLTIGNSVTTIGTSAFEGCSSLTEVTIPNSVTSIYSNAFRDCSSLKEVTIPNSVTSIFSGAFDGCSSLKEVTIPNSVTSIYPYAFSNCSNLKEVTIPNSVTSIEGSAFSNCTSLTGVSIPNTVTSIGESTFEGCNNLIEMSIPNSVTSIGSSAFRGCSSLTEMTIPNSVISIGDSTFEGCSSLTEMMIPNSVTSIGTSAFSGCSSLTGLSIPNSVASIGNYAFDDCSGLKKLIIEDGEKTLELGYNSYNSYSYYSTGEGLFYDCPLESVYLGRNLSYKTDSSYGYSPFYSKTRLTSLTIGSSVTSIGESTFSGCSNLTEVTIPNSVTEIGKSAFSGCSSLTEVTIPNSVTEIGKSAFSGCSGLTDVTIGNSVTRIGSSAFSGCSGLTDVTIGNSVTSIGEWAFRDCSGLTSLTIPNSVTTIDESAFSGCSGLTDVTIGNSVTRIYGEAFYGCSSLTEVTIPNSVTVIGSNAFEDCSNLRKLIIEDGEKTLSLGRGDYYNDYNPSYHGLFHCCPIDSLYLGRPLKYTKGTVSGTDYGFTPFDRYSLKTIIIGDSITSIPSEIFKKQSNLHNLTIGKSVTSIGKSAFSDSKCSRISTFSYNIKGLETSGLNSNAMITICGDEDVDDLCTTNLTDFFENIYFYDKNSIRYTYVHASESFTFENCVASNCGTFLVDCDKISIARTAENTEGKVWYQHKEIDTDVLSNGFAFKPSPYHALNDFELFDSDSCKDVDLKEAGTLNKEIAKQDQEKITRLKLKGDINGTDIITINRMTGLKALDLSEAKIVEGGYSYKESLFTENDVVGSQFFYNIPLERLALPESSNYIDKDALSNLTSLKFAGLGANTNTIANSAFSGCSNLKKIVLPESVETIGLNAFNGCKGIKEVYSLNPVPQEIDESVFDEYVYSNSTLHVKEGSKSLYAGAPVWKRFSTIEEDSEEQDITSKVIDIIDSTDNNAGISSNSDSYIEVYTLNGLLVYKGSRKEAQLERGVYVVRQGKVTAKIIVK